ncbi:MAG: hypothetical protein KA885_06415 [Spirochaetes bacterium]|nr:hypothetical protein [Spirochaetota bacterium]
MKYDFSLVINNEIREKILYVGKYFISQRISTIISRIIDNMHPYLKYYHRVNNETLPVYEKINWNKKIHIRIDYKTYLLLKKIYEDTNGYSIAFVIRRIIDYFIQNIEKFKSLGEFVLKINKLYKTKPHRIKKRQYDVWNIMKSQGISRFGRLIGDNKKREFPLNKHYLTIKYNEFYRPIEFSYS